MRMLQHFLAVGDCNGWIPMFQVGIPLLAIFLAFITYLKVKEKTAVDLTITWAKERKVEWGYAVTFAKKLKKEQAKALWNGWDKDLKIKGELKRLVDLAIDATKLPAGEGPPPEEFTLTAAQAELIRRNVKSYFNLLEGIILAWYYNTANQRILELEFRPLFEPKGVDPSPIIYLINAELIAEKATSTGDPSPKCRFPAIEGFRVGQMAPHTFQGTMRRVNGN